MGEAELLARLEALERRVARLEQGSSAVPLPVVTHPVPVERLDDRWLDAAIVGKCVLIVGGAYVLRALTETHVLPEAVGITLGFGYALFWIITRTTLLFVATGGVIAGGLAWETATRFHMIGAAGGSVLIAATAAALLWTALRRTQPLVAIVAVAVAIIASIGVALGTADALPASITVAAIGSFIAIRRSWPGYLTTAIAAASDSIFLTLIVLTLVDRTPHDVLIVQVAMLAIGALWAVTPSVPQAVIAIVMAVGGVAVLVPVRGANLVLAIAASLVAAGVSFWLARREPLFAISGAVALAAATLLMTWGSPLALVWSLVLAAMLARRRFELVATSTLAILVTAMLYTPPVAWTALLALAIAVLSLLSAKLPEASTLARVLLVIAGIKVVIQDLPNGQATTLVASLALYGGAILVFAQRRRNHET